VVWLLSVRATLGDIQVEVGFFRSEELCYFRHVLFGSLHPNPIGTDQFYVSPPSSAISVLIGLHCDKPTNYNKGLTKFMEEYIEPND
jgi:hypothetical protein